MVIRELEHIIQKALPRAMKEVFAEHFKGELREGKAETDEALFPFYDTVESYLSRNTKNIYIVIALSGSVNATVLFKGTDRVARSVARFLRDDEAVPSEEEAFNALSKVLGEICERAKPYLPYTGNPYSASRPRVVPTHEYNPYTIHGLPTKTFPFSFQGETFTIDLFVGR